MNDDYNFKLTLNKRKKKHKKTKMFTKGLLNYDSILCFMCVCVFACNMLMCGSEFIHQDTLLMGGLKLIYPDTFYLFHHMRNC